MTTRHRLLKIALGTGMIALGCVVFSVSKAHDPQNRAAIVAIVAIFMGMTWIGQGLRGHRELVIHHEEDTEPVEPIPAEKAGAGLLLAWAIPGMGHYLIGRKKKALLYFGVITLTFVAGVLLAHGRNLNYDRDGVYFLAYCFNAGETGIGWLLTRHLEFDHHIPHLHVGFLYSAVACLLNLVVVIDFYNTCKRSTDKRPTQSTTDQSGSASA